MPEPVLPVHEGGGPRRPTPQFHLNRGGGSLGPLIPKLYKMMGEGHGLTISSSMSVKKERGRAATFRPEIELANKWGTYDHENIKDEGGGPRCPKIPILPVDDRGGGPRPVDPVYKWGRAMA